MQVSKYAFEKWQSIPMLCLFVFILVLPVFEAPKTIFLCLFYLLAIYSIWKNEDKFCWKHDDILIVIWMLSGFIVAWFAGIQYKEWDGATGILKLSLFLLVLKNISLSEKLRKAVFMVILLSTLLATLEGLWQLFVTKQQTDLELHSVGHVNHSAIYLGLNFALALAMSLTLRHNDKMASKVFVMFCLLLTAASVILSNSRATILTIAVVATSFGLIWFKRSKWPLLVLVSGILITTLGLYFADAQVVQKHLIQTSQGPYLGERQAIWNSSLLAWQQFPVFGLGIKNFGEATVALQTEWLATQGKSFVEGQYLACAHVHNFYLATLAEQGLFGFMITMLVLGRIGFLLYKNRPRLFDSNHYWCSWLAAFGAIQVVLVNGLLNTTLHTEHGLLTLLLIGLWWGSLEQRSANVNEHTHS